MSIFGRIHFASKRDADTAAQGFKSLEGLSVVAGDEFEVFPNKMLLSEMLSENTSWVDEESHLNFVLLDRSSDDVSDGLLAKTPLMVR